MRVHEGDLAELGKRYRKEKVRFSPAASKRGCRLTASLVQIKLKAVTDIFQTRLTGNRLPLGPDANAHFAVPRGSFPSFPSLPFSCFPSHSSSSFLTLILSDQSAEWCRQWAQWSKQVPTKVSYKGLPGSIDNSPCICKHNLLCIDLNREAASPKLIEVVGPKEWEYLEEAYVFSRFFVFFHPSADELFVENSYEAAPAIRIWQSVDLAGPSSWPKVCEDCLDEQYVQPFLLLSSSG
jgi:hypothetical protein